VAPNVGFERFHARAVFAGLLLHLVRSVLRFVVIEDYVRAGLREELDRRSATIPREPPVMSAALPASEIIKPPSFDWCQKM